MAQTPEQLEKRIEKLEDLVKQLQGFLQTTPRERMAEAEIGTLRSDVNDLRKDVDGLMGKSRSV
jgi:hypothetical protein